MTTSARPAWGWGLATTTTSGDVLDVWYPSPALGSATGEDAPLFELETFRIITEKRSSFSRCYGAKRGV